MTNNRRSGRERERDQRRRREGTRGRNSTRASRRGQPLSAAPQQSRSNRSDLSAPSSQRGSAQTRPSSNRHGACSELPTTYPNNTTANRNTAPQEQEDPQPTTKDAMSEIKFLRIIIQAQHDRIEKLEQKEKRTADVLEALTKLALGTAQNTGGENEVREFSLSIGDV